VTRVVLQPAGDPYARQHYADTIAIPVPQEQLARFLGKEEMVGLRRHYDTAPVPTWGVTPGGRDANVGKWRRISPGDLVLMARDGEIFVSARVTYKAHNERLAEELWGRDENGFTWEYLYFLDDVTPQSLENSELNALVGYEPNARIQGFNVLDENKSRVLVDALGIEASAQGFDAPTHVRGLVGSSIPTLTGRLKRS
jgi:hypothetical protein